MNDFNVSAIFRIGWDEYCTHYQPSNVQSKAAYSIIYCKTGKLGYNVSVCQECNYVNYHANSCRNRNCPNCQAVQKEIWMDKRNSEIIDAKYFHVVFTVPAELNPLIYANQRLLYSLLHKCSSETLLDLCKSKKYLGATPGIIQVLHTWGQELNYHPHIHCIISGGGLTKSKELKLCSKSFLIRIEPLVKKFRGKFLHYLQQYYNSNKLVFSKSCSHLCNRYTWKEFKNKLYSIDWNAEIKETFNGNGNAIEYLARYSNRIAITNNRITNISENKVSFWAKNYKTGNQKIITITCTEFIRRFMMHILPKGFQKIRYYGFLNNRWKSTNLKLIFCIQNRTRPKPKLEGLSVSEILMKVWNYNICSCPKCGCNDSMHQIGRKYVLRN